MRDFYKFDSLLTEEERIFKESLHKWADNVLYPRVNQIWTDGSYDKKEHEWLRSELAKMGLFGIKEQGGSNVEYGIACQELEAVDSGIRSFMSVQNSLVIGLLNKYGSFYQKNLVQELIGGRLTGCFALTEPNAGSNPAAMKTHATPIATWTGTKGVEDYDKVPYQISGSKIFITNGVFADFLLVWAINKSTNKIQAFALEADQYGIKRHEVPNKMSLRYSDTAELYFDDAIAVEIPTAIGLKAALSCLTNARYGIAWGAIGAARSCFERVYGYVMDRVQFNDKLLGSHQLIQEKLVEMVSEIVKAQFMTLQLGRLMDKGEANYAQVALAKRNNVRMALQIARDARDLLGAYGICTEYDVVRHMMNLESVITYEGSHNIQTLIVGRDLTGIGAF